MKKIFSCFLGVVPGYEGIAMADDQAFEKGFDAVKTVFKKKRTFQTIPARAVYRTDWGCPEGGESGILLLGTTEDIIKFESKIVNLMAILGQTTATVEYPETGHATYITNVYEEGVTPCKETLLESKVTRDRGLWHFEEKWSEKLNFVAKAIQHAQLEAEADEYIVTGIVFVNEFGRTVFTGTQNRQYGQKEKELYKNSVNHIIARIKTLPDNNE